jgi:protein-L-isoaspartate O-methyltransferase
MLELAGVSESDTVYDMGSGDGRIVIMAAQRHGAKSVGVELDAGLVKESRERVKELGLDGRVTIIEGDLLQTDLSPASVVTVYLLPSANAKLRPILEKELRPGSRVVAHDMGIPGWTPAKEEEFRTGNVIHYIYLYTVPDAFRR